MKEALREQLVRLAKRRITNRDPSHDFEHARRVLGLAERIARIEGADLTVLIPAALFHDLVNYSKNDPRAKLATDESAAAASNILTKLPDFPKNKIAVVASAIRDCSFKKGIKHTDLEAQILQDADGLEATGVISIMRTFASTGCMQRPFYNPDDPFCKKRDPEPLKYAIDLFYDRLLKVEQRMYTKTAKGMARTRTVFLRKFLKEMKRELEEANILK